MEISGAHTIPAPREKVWKLLNDPETLRECIPGCQSLEGNPEDGFIAAVRLAIGPVKATFDGAVTLSDVNPQESYRISGQGKGGIAGFASGGADVRLAEAEGNTVLSYEAQARVGGKIAQLGGRLIDSTARKLANEFFAKFARLAADN